MGPALSSDEADRGLLGAPILRHRSVRPGTPPGKLSRFEDTVWHLAPAHPDAHAKINAIRWDRWPAELVEVFKTIALAFLEYPVPRSVTVTSDGEPMSIGTLAFRLRTLRVFAAWMSQHHLPSLREVTDQQLECYRRHVLGLETSNRHKRDLFIAARTVWDYRAYLPPHCRLDTHNPWGGTPPSRLAAAPCRPAGTENTTPRVAPATMEALLDWSLRMVEVIGPDIVAARAELDQLEAGTHPSQVTLDGLSSRQRLQAFAADASRQGHALPGHPSRNSQEPRINWSHLARMLQLPQRQVPPSLQPVIVDSGLQVDDGSPVGMITGPIEERPWRERPLTTHELPGLVSHLSAESGTDSDGEEDGGGEGADDGVLWSLEASTEAKHRLYARYLDAWFAILLRQNRSTLPQSSPPSHRADEAEQQETAVNDGPVYGGSPRERAWWMRPGVHESSILLGTVASPLLAGFALTLAVSILKDGKVMGFPSLALVSFTLAAGLLLLSLQATIRMRAAYWSAGELDAFLNRARDTEATSKAQQQRDKDALAWSRWRTTATNSHNLGLLAFLVGVAAALAPNGDSAYWGARLGSALLVALFAVSWTAFAVIPAAAGSGRG